MVCKIDEIWCEKPPLEAPVIMGTETIYSSPKKITLALPTVGWFTPALLTAKVHSII